MDPSILFVIIGAAALVALVIGFAFQNWFLGFFGALALVGSAWMVAGATLVFLVVNYWQYIGVGVFVYILVGMVYSLYRYWAKVNSDQVQSTLNSKISEWKTSGSDQVFKKSIYFPSYLFPSKAEIISWIAYWPVSLVFYFLGDVLRDLFVGIYNRIHGVFTAIGDRAIRRAGGE